MAYSVKIDPVTGQRYMSIPFRGRDVLVDPLINKGTAFNRRERDDLQLNGLLPPAVTTMKEQLDRTYERFLAQPADLEKYVNLTNLHDRNETLFFRLVYEHIDEMMPIVYTPVVGEACQKFSHIYRTPRGLYIDITQKGRIEQVLRGSPVTDPSVIVVTDGERILGLGDQGAGGMGIPIGKLCLYTLCAGISPFTTIPIMLDAGTDNEERLKDPLYLGLRRRRVRDDEYQAFIDEFVAAVQKVFPTVLLQWEDFLKANAIKQLQRFRDNLCTFNDDIQGTAGVVVAGFYSGMRITGKKMRDQKIVFAGAGASAQGISDLLVSAIMEEGLTKAEAQKRIWTTDSKGLVTRDRSNLEDFKATYARETAEVAAYKVKEKGKVTLEELVANVKPTMLIGTSGTPGTFTEPVVRAMAAVNERPMVFPLSNPTSKAECTAEQAIQWSDGRAIVATGSPFSPVTYKGQRFRIGQGNNAFVFPGVGLGVTVCRAKRVTDGMFLEAAKALADQVSEKDLKETAVYPELARIRECSHAVACAVVHRAVKEGHAAPDVLDNLEHNVKQAMWFPEYIPIRYEPGR